MTDPDPTEEGLSAEEIRRHVDEYREEHGLPPQKG
jgi:hypothetical protein